MKYFLIVILLLTGCETETNRHSTYNDWRKPAIDACINQGGIPILSSWDGRLIDCKFKEENKK